VGAGRPYNRDATKSAVALCMREISGQKQSANFSEQRPRAA
jgi:hypothetical protein